MKPKLLFIHFCDAFGETNNFIVWFLWYAGEINNGGEEM